MKRASGELWPTIMGDANQVGTRKGCCRKIMEVRMSIKKGDIDRETYYSHAGEADMPIRQRPESVEGRGGDKRKLRRHHMFRGQMDQLVERMREQGRWVCPFNPPKAYWGVVEALYQLGPNKRHLFGEVYAKMREVMSQDQYKDAAGRTPWEKFDGKLNRSSTTGKDSFDRIMQNMRVLQRLGGENPYGLKLAQVGACINLYGTKSKPFVELRIGIPSGDDVSPVNDARERNYPKSVYAVPSGFMPDGEVYVVDWLSIDELAKPSSLLDEVDRVEELDPNYVDNEPEA